MKRNGYSLYELMIVLAIIVIVASIMLPVFTSAKVKAKSITCVSNMRQLHVAMMLYREDHGEYPINAADHPGMKPYFPTLLRCPAYSRWMKPGTRDYSMYGSMVASVGPYSTRIDLEISKRAFSECREKRGSDMVVIVDKNHRPKLLDKSNTKDFYLLARENGSITQISVAQALTGPSPCNDSVIASEYNY